MKYAYRKIPFPYYEVENLESWLSSLSGKGLYPVHFNNAFFFVKCKKGEPGHCRVRLEPFRSRDEAVPESGLMELYEAAGWEYLGPLSKLFHVFRTLDPKSPEPYLSADEYYASAMKQYFRRVISDCTVVAVTLLVALTIFVLSYILRDYPMIEAVNSGLWRIPLLLLLCAVGASITLYELLTALKLRRRLVKGLPLRRSRRFSRFHLSFRFVLSLCVFIPVIVWYTMLFAQTDLMKTYTADSAADLPFPLISELVPDAEPGGARYNDMDYANYIRIRRDMIVTETYELRQEDNRGCADLYVKCFVTDEKHIASRLAYELTPQNAQETELLWSQDEYYIKYFTMPSAFHTGTDQCLVILTQDRAAFVRFFGSADLRAYASAFAGV